MNRLAQPQYEIIIAEDERLIRQHLVETLENAGYTVRAAENGEKALKLFFDHPADLLLLDIMMPKLNGLDLCRKLRKLGSSTPILFLTALNSDDDEIVGLECGCDGYIFKSVSTPVLLARIAAAIRRREREDPRGDFSFSGYRVQPSCSSMRSPKGETISLTEREISLLRCFAMHPNEILSHDFICTRLWGNDHELSINALFVAISRLRDKLGAERDAIGSIRTSGYIYRSAGKSGTI